MMNISCTHAGSQTESVSGKGKGMWSRVCGRTVPFHSPLTEHCHQFNNGNKVEVCICFIGFY